MQPAACGERRNHDTTTDKDHGLHEKAWSYHTEGSIFGTWHHEIINKGQRTSARWKDDLRGDAEIEKQIRRTYKLHVLCADEESLEETGADMNYKTVDDDYGVNTDSPETPYEYFMEVMNNESINAIREGFKDWKKEVASEYFDTFSWGDDEWDDWEEFIINNI